LNPTRYRDCPGQCPTRRAMRWLTCWSTRRPALTRYEGWGRRDTGGAVTSQSALTSSRERAGYSTVRQSRRARGGNGRAGKGPVPVASANARIIPRGNALLLTALTYCTSRELHEPCTCSGEHRNRGVAQPFPSVPCFDICPPLHSTPLPLPWAILQASVLHFHRQIRLRSPHDRHEQSGMFLARRRRDTPRPRSSSLLLLLFPWDTVSVASPLGAFPRI
jgi:hypothetical protein